MCQIGPNMCVSSTNMAAVEQPAIYRAVVQPQLSTELTEHYSPV